MIASGKGGTGKSTVSVLLGGCLGARKKKVLLIELGLSGAFGDLGTV